MFVMGFESIFEKFLHLGEICNDTRLYNNAYKVLIFENISLESVGVFERCLKICCEQENMNVLPTQKVLVLFLLLYMLLSYH